VQVHHDEGVANRIAPALRSTDSAAVGTAAFVGFLANMAGSDFSRPCIIGYGFSTPARNGTCCRNATPRAATM
jgi:hypothetical protein